MKLRMMISMMSMMMLFSFGLLAGNDSPQTIYANVYTTDTDAPERVNLSAEEVTPLDGMLVRSVKLYTEDADGERTFVAEVSQVDGARVRVVSPGKVDVGILTDSRVYEWMEPYADLLALVELLNNDRSLKMFVPDTMFIYQDGFITGRESVFADERMVQWTQNALHQARAEVVFFDGTQVWAYGRTQHFFSQMQNVEAFFAGMNVAYDENATLGYDMYYVGDYSMVAFGMMQPVVVDDVPGVDSVVVNRGVPWNEVITGTYTAADLKARPFDRVMTEDPEVRAWMGENVITIRYGLGGKPTSLSINSVYYSFKPSGKIRSRQARQELEAQGINLGSLRGLLTQEVTR